MTTVEEALQIIKSQRRFYGTENISFLKATQRVLAEAIYADLDFPSFNRVCMDGIAISYDAFEKGCRVFRIEGIQAAGSPQMTKSQKENCLEVMTGAVLPNGADVIVPYEKVEISNGFAKVLVDEVSKLQHVHLKGKDRSKGSVLIKKNTVITAAEVGILATVGKTEVLVKKQPKVLIVSTGDELVDVNQTPLAHQIRRSNVYSLQSMINGLGIEAETQHLEDDKEMLEIEIAKQFELYDVLIFSGAVSKGKYDYLPEVLEGLGVKKSFHRVKQRPGKPFWFGVKDEKIVFAFPGNPVSTYVNCLQYFYPWYQISMGLNNEPIYATLSEDVTFKPALTYFLQVRLKSDNATLVAEPVSGNGSGDLANMVAADAFVILPPEQTHFEKGAVFPVLRYR
ncbi:MAG: molybdopterin molybdotransferase MoeA [Flavicella sp.]